MAIRFDFACKKCETTFTVWSDAAKCCPACGSKRVFKVFLTPPAASTGNAAAIDKLAEAQIDAAGLSNYTNQNGNIRRTRKTDPKHLEAIAAAKRHNVPYEKTPIVTQPNGAFVTRGQAPQQVPVGLGRQIASRGKGTITHNPKGTGAIVSGLMQSGRKFSPLNGPYRLPKDGGRDDSVKLKAMIK